MAKMNYMEPIFFTPPRNKIDRALYKDSPSPAPAPTSQTVTNTSIPEYARPYVETMLGKAQALTDVNANPYQAYGGTRIAGFSPLQQSAFQNVANQQTASQLGTATGLAGLSGVGSIGAANAMAGAGANYQGQATNPYAVQAYMNPYLNASLQPQLAEIGRQGQIAANQAASQATSAGAFGGTRGQLAQAEARRNALNAQQQAIGQGYNTAFQNAQQAQQFGANLGLQGLQGALSGYGQAGAAAGTLGQLGQTQFGQQQAINQAQQQVGAVQQAQQQQQLDQAYQDFLKQKNYPYQQLAYMSDMLRGLPLSQSAQQQYTAPPSMVSQLGGLGMAGLGIYGAAGGFRGAKEGGLMKTKKMSVGGKTEMLSESQLQAIIEDPTANPLKVAAAEEQLMLRRRMRNNPETADIMGLGAIDTGDMVPPETVAAAGGGIIAFSQGKEVKSKVPIPSNIESYAEKEQKGIDADRQALEGFQFAKSQAATDEINKQIQAAQEKEGWNYLRDIGIGTLKGTSPYTLTNVGGGGEYAGTQAEKREASTDSLRKLALQQQVEQEKTDYAKRAAMLNVRQQGLTNLMNKELALQQIKASKGATDAQRDYTNAIRAQSMIQTAIEKEKANLIQDKSQTFDYSKNPAKLEADATSNVMARIQKYQPDLLKMLNYNMNIVNPDKTTPEAPVGAGATAATTPGTVGLPGKNAPVAKPIPLPNIADKNKLASSLVVGQPYATNNGTGVWDGKQFIRVQ